MIVSAETERYSDKVNPAESSSCSKRPWTSDFRSLAEPPTLSPLDPQHPQHLGKYETKLRSDPQQSRNKAATKGATAEPVDSG